MQEQIQKQKELLRNTELFVIKYDSKIPKGLGMLIFGVDYVCFYVSLDGKTDSDRNRALAVMGDIFGRGGWDAQLEYRGRHFDWSKMLDSVSVKISCAQPIGKPEKFPVDPKSFPLQLEEDTTIPFNNVVNPDEVIAGF